MASLYERSGTYYAQFYDQERSPARKQISLRTKDKGTARALLVRWERLYLTGEVDPWTDDLHEAVRPEPPEEETSIEEAQEDFLQSREDKGVSHRTLRRYRGNLRRLLGDMDTSAPLKALKAPRVREYVHEEGLASSTKATRYRALAAFFRHAGREEVLGRVEKPTVSRGLPVACRKAELKAICEAVTERYRELRMKGHIPAGKLIWRLPAWRFSFLTGLRRSELKRLRWTDVNLQESDILLREQKRGWEERLPISSKARRLLERVSFRGSREGWVFEGPYRTGRGEAWADRMTRTFTEYRRRARVREGVSLHSLRAAYVTRLARAGVSPDQLKRLARHRSLDTTMRYIEASRRRDREALEEAFGAS